MHHEQVYVMNVLSFKEDPVPRQGQFRAAHRFLILGAYTAETRFYLLNKLTIEGRGPV